SLSILAESIPRSQPIILQLPLRGRRFEENEGFPNPLQEFRFRDFAELGFRIVQIIDVHARNPHVPQTAVQLVFKVAWRHAVAAGGNVFCAENSRPNVFAEEIFVRIRGHGTVRRQVSALRADYKFLSRKTSGGELLKRRADAALPALKAVIDGRIENVDSVLNSRNDGFRVSRVRFLIGRSEICSDTERG